VVAKVRERLAVNKQRSHRFYMRLNDVEGKEQFELRSQIGLQLWKIWIQRWKLIVPGKQREYKNFSQREPRLF
jgi:hypothetical protein